MNDLKKSALWLSLTGFIMGILMGVFMQYMIDPAKLSVANVTAEPKMLCYLILSGLYGALAVGSSVVYAIESWSIIRVTVTHFLLTVGGLAIFFTAIIRMGWMAIPPIKVCVIMAVAFVVVYFLIWLVQYLVYRYRVRKMNAKLRKWKAEIKKKDQPN